MLTTTTTIIFLKKKKNPQILLLYNLSNGPMARETTVSLEIRESCELSTGWETGKGEPLNMSVQYSPQQGSPKFNPLAPKCGTEGDSDGLVAAALQQNPNTPRISSQ